MLELSLPPRLQEKAVRIAKSIEELQKQWPRTIVLSAGAVTIYDCFPYFFDQAFPSIRESDLDSFAVAARLYASSIFLQDKVFDQGQVRDAHMDVAPVNVLRILAMQWEAYRLLNALFPHDSAFWGHFRGYLTQFSSACLEEQRFIADVRTWREFSEELALDIAKGKNGIARTTIAGLVEMEQNSCAFEPLTEAIDGYNCARQMWDDLADWKEDLEAGTPSLLLTRILKERPHGLNEEELSRLKAEVGRELFYGGHAKFVLELALSTLDRAEAGLAAWPKLAWRKVHESLRGECSLLLGDIERIVSENVTRVRKQQSFDLHLPDPISDWQQLAWPALRYIIEEWHGGFGEGRHVMYFPPELGFSGPPYQRGDVFQRALIADVLCDAEEYWNLGLQPVINQEIDYLLSRRDSGRGGWRYFAELLELPPDADDLAQILQLLWRSGRRQEIDNYCAGPLALLFQDNAYADGSFETWIIPGSDRTPGEARQAEFARNMWGVGPDPDVMGNLLYALALIDGPLYSENLDRGVRYLLGKQTPSGCWNSTWYHGPYYGTYVCMRLLSRVCPNAQNVQLAGNFLRTKQNLDGGWGDGESSNPLDTAFALLALGHVQKSEWALRTDVCAAFKGLAYLRATAGVEGTWPSHEFIRMDTARAAGGVSHIVSYGSRTMTTAFVLKSAASWDGLISKPSKRRRPSRGQ